ncbi:MAG: hypothetical protein OHK0057_10010 [Thermoflexibacter sp.]
MVFLNCVLFAQPNERIDSLENLLKNAKEDSNKVLIMYQLAWNYLSSKPEKMKEYTLKGIALAHQIRFYHGEVLLLNRLGDYYSHAGNYPRAIEYATQSLKLAETTNDSIGIADAHVLLGIIHQEGLKNKELAMRHHIEALKIYEKQKNEIGVAATLNLLARFYSSTKRDLPLALQYTEKSITIAQGTHNEDFLAWCLTTRGSVYNDAAKFDSALFYFQKATQAYQRAKDKTNVAINGLLIGNVYLKQGKFSQALQSYWKQLYPIKELKANALLRDAYKGLAEVYAAQKRYDSAYLYHFWYSQLKDSIFNEETAQKVAIVQSQYEEEKKEAKIALLEKEKEIAKDEKQHYIVGFAGFALLVLFVLFFIVRSNQQKQKVNRLLEEKNKKIATQNEELLQAKEEITVQRDMLEEQNKQLREVNDTKNKLFSIVSHDLRSPINRLKGILSLVVHDAISEAELKMYFATLYGNINSLHDTLDNLLQWAYSQMEGIKSNPQKVDIHQLIKNHIILFSEITKVKQIEISQEVPSGLYTFADENQVRLILRNLIHNAIKFTPLQGQITIFTKQIEGFIEIAVKDTGVGMSKEQLANLFQTKLYQSTQGTQGEKGTGLGLFLCKEMAEKNGGKIWAESVEGKGSIFHFTLPTDQADY